MAVVQKPKPTKATRASAHPLEWPTTPYPDSLPNYEIPEMQQLRDQFQSMRGRHIYEADASADSFDLYELRYVAALAALKWGDVEEVKRLASLPPCKGVR